MSRKLLLSAFLAVILVQCIDSVPAPPAEDDDSSSNEIEHSNTISKKKDNDELPGRKYLRFGVYKNTTSFMNFQLLRTYQIAKDVLADPAISSVDTENMRNECRTLNNYVKEAKVTADARPPPDKADRQSYFFFRMGKGFILEHFNGYVRSLNASRTLHEFSDEEKLIWAALLRHGYGDYHQELDQRGEVFAINIANAVLQYVDSLNPAEKEQEADLVKLCQEYERNRSRDNKVKFGIALSQIFLAFEEE